jgi:hypothetical protein
VITSFVAEHTPAFISLNIIYGKRAKLYDCSSKLYDCGFGQKMIQYVPLSRHRKRFIITSMATNVGGTAAVLSSRENGQH